MKTFVFLGPSLPIEQAKRELDGAVFLPPVRRGDIYRLVAESDPAVIGIVDGFFDTVPAVIHKEILFAISQKVRVLGAASMGALRAAEMWQFGMEGVGRIFEQYRSGQWTADDEVAVMHGPAEANFRSGSVAMATIRFALEEARNRGVISGETMVTLTRLAKEQFYPDRSWNGLHRLGLAAGVPAEQLSALDKYVATEQPDAKRDDALALLRRLRKLTTTEEGSRPNTFDFEATIYWERLIGETKPIVAATDEGGPTISNSDVARHVSVQPGGADRMRGAALLHLLIEHARRHPIVLKEDEKQSIVDQFRRRHGLLSGQRTREWFAAQHLTEDELLLLIKLELALEAILRENSGAIRGLLPLELKRRGEFAEASHAIALKKGILADAGVRSLTLEDLGVSFADLLQWYQMTRGSINRTIGEHSQQLGFESTREFLSEVLLDYASQAGRKSRTPDPGSIVGDLSGGRHG